jgi:hypothetical protein
MRSISTQLAEASLNSVISSYEPAGDYELSERRLFDDDDSLALAGGAGSEILRLTGAHSQYFGGTAPAAHGNGEVARLTAAYPAMFGLAQGVAPDADDVNMPAVSDTSQQTPPYSPPAADRYCPECGAFTTSSDSARFCAGCGAALPADDAGDVAAVGQDPVAGNVDVQGEVDRLSALNRSVLDSSGNRSDRPRASPNATRTS